MKKASLVFLVCFLACVLTGVSALAADAPLVLKLAHITAPGGMLDKKARKYAELVAEKSGGRVKIEIYPAQQLGNIKEIHQGLSLGTIDMCQENEGLIEPYDSDYAIIATPFLFTRQELENLPLLTEIRERVLKKAGIRTLPGQAFRPKYHLFTQRQAYPDPDTLGGVKIRVWQSKAMVDTWTGLGAVAVPLPWGDVYLSLSQKVVNGLSHNLVQVRDEKFYEQLEYCTYLDFLSQMDVTWISERRWKKLTPEVQAILSEASLEVSAWFDEFTQGLEDEATAQMEKAGMKFVQGDRDKWVAKASVIHKELERSGVWSPGLLQKVGKE